MNPGLSIPKAEPDAFCRVHAIRKLSIFDLEFRKDFLSNCDVDILVEFLSNRIPGSLGMAGMGKELSAPFGGRKVDLRTPKHLSRYFRRHVLDTAEVQHARG